MKAVVQTFLLLFILNLLLIFGFSITRANAITADNVISPMRQDTILRDRLITRLVIGVFWPIVFVSLEVVINRLARGSSCRDGERKFRIVKGKTQKSRQIVEPLDLSELQAEVSKSATTLVDIDLLPSSFWETSMGIDLSITALSAITANIEVIQTFAIRER